MIRLSHHMFATNARKATLRIACSPVLLLSFIESR
jgi:hypothetical protein